MQSKGILLPVGFVVSICVGMCFCMNVEDYLELCK